MPRPMTTVRFRLWADTGLGAPGGIFRRDVFDPQSAAPHSLRGLTMMACFTFWRPSPCQEEQKPAGGCVQWGPADCGLRRRSSTTGSARLPASRLLASHQNLSAIRSRIYWTRHLGARPACGGQLNQRKVIFSMRRYRPVSALGRNRTRGAWRDLSARCLRSPISRPP